MSIISTHTNEKKRRNLKEKMVNKPSHQAPLDCSAFLYHFYRVRHICKNSYLERL